MSFTTVVGLALSEETIPTVQKEANSDVTGLN